MKAYNAEICGALNDTTTGRDIHRVRNIDLLSEVTK